MNVLAARPNPGSSLCDCLIMERAAAPGPRAVIWLLCHYPDVDETDERVEKAVQLQRELGLPVWLYGSTSARYPASVERLIKQKLIARGVKPDAVLCSVDLVAEQSLDTVQEARNVAAEAKRQNVQTIFCISNKLQLLQVRALLRQEPLNFVWIATRLRDRRWWYVIGRLVLIPLAYLGMGNRFAPLVFVRWARINLAAWPF
jgi:uncharacterized SAM-binding protein YcdF (DUF218 family)